MAFEARSDDFSPYRLSELREGYLFEGADGSASPAEGFRDRFHRGSPLRDLRILCRFADFPVKLTYDCVPLSEDSLLLFILCNVNGSGKPEVVGSGLEGMRLNPRAEEFRKPNWRMQVYHYRGEWLPKERHWAEKPWTLQETFRPAFTEPFQAFAVGDTYFFVTQSGKVFAAPKPKTGERAMKAIWDDAERPVVDLLSDADTGRVFLFGKPEKGTEKGVYFELAEEPRPLPYNLAAVETPKTEESVRNLFRYAHFLIKEGKVKGK